MHAQEEGRVVFFCGAGISCSAGLPLFSGLVKDLYSALEEEETDPEKKACEQSQYDMALCSFENRITGGRVTVRKELKAILEPDCRKKDALTMHKALLQLGTDRKGSMRLVTTNYDFLFQRASKSLHLPIREYASPLLPVPKPSQWDGLVYLHGLLPKNNNERDLDRLILSSADFGLAYLTEGWASRFLTELFRHYIVCFVGYSLNDPVLRYMTDALAADRIRGDAIQEDFYAFVPFGGSTGKRENVIAEWQTKKITPILYKTLKTKPENDNHSILYNTFRVWSEIYRDGISGKKKIVAKYALNPPLPDLTYDDETVDNILWALADEEAFRFFAEMDPPPPLEWLDHFEIDRFTINDLHRFGRFGRPGKSQELKFSILSVPAPYDKSSIKIVRFAPSVNLDNRMYHLATWLLKHLNDPNLALWLASKGGELHPHFKYLLQKSLMDSSKQNNSTNLYISENMKLIWALFLAGRIGTRYMDFEVRQIVQKICDNGLTPWLRELLVNHIAPCITITKSLSANIAREANSESEKLGSLFHCRLATRGAISRDEFRRANADDNKNWYDAMIDLFDDFNYSLRELMNLKALLGGEKAFSDLVYALPSIEYHQQNKPRENWVVLVELVRDAWSLIAERDSKRAIRIASDWWQEKSILFKRLALFAAKKHEVIPLGYFEK